MESVDNPYDFVNPVTDPEEFAGRFEELKEIEYYLDLTKSVKPKYIHLALNGKRAVGKTSLLNMVNHQASQRKFLPVKIILNNETSQDDVLFFKEVIDNIMTEGAKRGMYGGIKNKVYQGFRKTIDSLELQADVPLLFGSVYIGKKQKNSEAKVPQHILITDLKELYSEAEKKGIPTIVLLLDECDLLAQNETLLQKIRNVFMEVKGFMLVLSGTDNMFPAINKVFSPAPRLFKRINVDNFKTVQEVLDCVLNPLSEEEKKKVNRNSIQELFMLSGGMPYEVKLISHFMYKHYKQTGSEFIGITVDVLDNVFNELERLREKFNPEIIKRIQQCNTPSLKVLLSLLELSNATPEQLIKYSLLDYVEGISVEKTKERSDSIGSTISILIHSELIKEDDNQILTFIGDDLDRLYLKYFAISKKVDFFLFGGGELIQPIQQKFQKVLFDDLPAYKLYTMFNRKEGGKGQLFIMGGKYKLPPGESIIEFGSPRDWEKSLMEDPEDSIKFRVNVNYIGDGFVTQLKFDSNDIKEKALKKLESFQHNLRVIGIDVSFETEFLHKLNGNAAMKSNDPEKAIEHYNKAIEINPLFEYGWADKGLALMAMGKYQDSIDCFDECLRIRPKFGFIWLKRGDALKELKRFDDALQSYDKLLNLEPLNFDGLNNKGNVLLDMGKLKEAISYYDQAMSIQKNHPLPWNNKAAAYRALGHLEESLKCCNKALELDPKLEIGFINKGLTLMDSKKYSEAVESMDLVLQTYPKKIIFWKIKANAHEALGEMNEAIKCVDIIIEEVPSDSQAWLHKGFLEIGIDDKENAATSIKKAMELDKELRKTLQTIGMETELPKELQVILSEEKTKADSKSENLSK